MTDFIAPAHACDAGGPVGRAFQPFADPGDVRDLVAELRRAAAGRPAAPAVVEAGGTTSYGALIAELDRLAAAVAGAGGAGPAAILLPSGATYVAAVFACLAAGRIGVLLDDASPAERNAHIIEDVGASVLIAGSGAPDLGLPRVDPAAPPAPSGQPATRLDPDAPAFVLATSGSTGRPKCIAHSQRTMFHWARTTHNALHVRPEDRALSLSAFASLGGFTALLSYPLAGASIDCLDVRAAGLGGLFDRLLAGGVTILRAAPSMMRNLARRPEARAAFAGLRIVQTYGEPLTRADLEAIEPVLAPGCLIRTTYGSTECSGLSGFVRAVDADPSGRLPSGRLMPDTDAALEGAAADPEVPGAVQGELVIRSRWNALGEFVGGRLEAGRLRADPQDPTRRRYATGDVARLAPDGLYTVLGRRDRMVKVNGQRLEPAEVEAALAACPGVERAEVVADHGSAPARLLAFVVAAVPGPDLESRLKAELRRRLPAYMTPARIHAVDAIPVLPSGKVDQGALLALGARMRGE